MRLRRIARRHCSGSDTAAGSEPVRARTGTARKVGRLAVLGMTCLGATAMVVGTGGVASAAPGCVALDVIAIPGTWETSDNGAPAGAPGLLGAVTYGLPGSMRADYVPYAATAFPWETAVYGASKYEAVTNARAMMADTAAQCPGTRFAIIGYSQGADAAGDLAAQIGHNSGPVAPDKIAGVGLISDPRRSSFDDLVGPPVVGNGAGGARIGGFGAVGGDVRTFCAAGDLYCAAPPGDFVTRLAGYLVQNSDPGSSEPDRYRPEGIAIVDDLMAAGGLPTLGAQLTGRANDARQNEIESFLGSGIHQDYTAYAVDANGTSATEWLRSWLINRA